MEMFVGQIHVAMSSIFKKMAKTKETVSVAISTQGLTKTINSAKTSALIYKSPFQTASVRTASHTQTPKCLKRVKYTRQSAQKTTAKQTNIYL